MQMKGDPKTGVPIAMSKSQLRRFMDEGVVLIDNDYPDSKTLKPENELPEHIIFFPNDMKKRVQWG
jgi:hypothetical protein